MSDMRLVCKRYLNADDIYGQNRCTTCVHYQVIYDSQAPFYGCEKNNAFTRGEVWNRPNDDPLHPCEDYCTDMVRLQSIKDRLKGDIDEIAQELHGYGKRLELLQEIERTCGSAHQADTDGHQAEEQR